jgi:O-antigen/teichoic acid export membrane protein
MTGSVLRVSRNVLWLGAGEAAIKAALFVIAAVVARTMGPAAMGTFTIAYGAALMALMILAAGQQEVVIREVAARPAAARGIVGRARTAQLRVAAVALPIMVAGTMLVTAGDLRATLLAFVPYAAVRTIVVTHGAVFKGLDRMDVEVRARGIEVAVVVPGLAAAGFAGWPVWTTGIAFSVGATAALAWLMLHFARIGGRQDCAALRAMTEGLPFLGLAVLTQVLTRADTMLLAGFRVAREHIGHYGAGSAPVWGGLAVCQLFGLALYPTLSRRAATGRPMRGTLGLAMAAGILIGGAAAGALFTIREPLISIAFGAAFAPSIELLVRLVWLLPWAVSMALAGTVFAAWRRQRLALATLAAVVGLSLSLNLRWIPADGVHGAAAAAVWAHAAGAVLLLGIGLAVGGPFREEGP